MAAPLASDCRRKRRQSTDVCRRGNASAEGFVQQNLEIAAIIAVASIVHVDEQTTLCNDIVRLCWLSARKPRTPLRASVESHCNSGNLNFEALIRHRAPAKRRTTAQSRRCVGPLHPDLLCADPVAVRIAR